jgi:hypothetical protein
VIWLSNRSDLVKRFQDESWVGRETIHENTQNGKRVCDVRIYFMDRSCPAKIEHQGFA